MAGRIREESIAEVREKARIDDVVGQYVTLRNAGGGSQKGLCPFHDEKTPSFNVNVSRGTYHCLAGETRVLTYDGVRPIAELAGGTHRILGSSGQWIEAPFKSYGVQRLYKLTLTRNRQVKELFATDGHRWFVKSGRTREATREVLTADLKPAQRLVTRFPASRIRRTTPSPFGIAHGFTFGDGTRDQWGSRALLCPPKDLAMLKWFPNSHTTAHDDALVVHHLPRFFKDVPSLDESFPYLYGWLAGYFAADGCVAADGTVILNSAKRENLQFVRDLCTRLGIGTYGITSQSREGFPGRERSDLFRVHLIGEDLTEDFFLIEQHHQRFVSVEKRFARRGWVVQSVEESSRIEEVYCAEVEDGRAFTLEDNLLTGNCFGCSEGGDVISFVQKLDGLTFMETVERLADKYGVVLKREEGGSFEDRPRGPARGKLIEANRVAQEFYAEQLLTPAAAQARQFLQERQFTGEDAERFGVGFAPRGGEDLLRHLRARGFSEEECIAAGLVAQSQRGGSGYDRFRGRLLWPIRETSGDTIGFGARRIFEDDRIDAKYLNTPETTLYKKSRVLYGIDLARKQMGLSSQAVVVEGYTDVMACHLAGVGTAVASCGTAFGDEHAKVLRRHMADHDEFRGEVIFTFDGDAAGQAAALKAFQGDQNFASQTYVAVEPDGLDPCDLRIKHGDDAVRELIARRAPLYRFVLGNVVKKYDLDRADGRVDALRESARLVASIRDQSKVTQFAQEISRMIGFEVDTNVVLAEVRKANTRSRSGSRATPGEAPPQPRNALPDLRDPRFAIERETLKLVIQHPVVIGRTTGDVGPEDFMHPTYRAVWEVVAAAGGPLAGASDPAWSSTLLDAAAQRDPALGSVVSALSVEPLPAGKEPSSDYVLQYVVRLLELTALRRIATVKARLQRTNPVEEAEAYNRMFGELAALEAHRRRLRDRIVGGE